MNISRRAIDTLEALDNTTDGPERINLLMNAFGDMYEEGYQNGYSNEWEKAALQSLEDSLEDYKGG